MPEERESRAAGALELCVQHADGGGALADGRGDSADGAAAHVAHGEGPTPIACDARCAP